MTSLPPGSPGTPPHAQSEHPSTIPRNPMEDADSSVTRKRPRLDSGEREHRTMTPETSLPGAPSSDRPPRHANASNEASHHGTATATSSQAADCCEIVQITPSKVTINVRDPSLALSPPQDANSHLHGALQSEESPTLARMRLSDDAKASTPPEVIEDSPSTVGSPEIEVAEPEDVHSHVGPTVWHKEKEEDNHPRHDPEYLIDRFPYLTARMPLQDAIEELAEKLQDTGEWFP